MPSHFSSPSSTSSSSSSVLSIASMDRCIDELHFDVPLISTRRVLSVKKFDPNESYSVDTSRRVPFLWERAPGVPKDDVVRGEEEEVFTPKPPPGRWRPPSFDRSNGGGGGHDNGDVSHCASYDASDNDMFSLSESLETWAESGIPCRLSVSKDTGPSVTRAQSFIMNRFLPAANALAASSVASLPQNPTRIRTRSGPRDLTRMRLRHVAMAEARKIQAQYGHGLRTDPRPASPSKACGIMLLFPWNMKRAICGLKSPIQGPTPRMASIDQDYRGRCNKRSNFDEHGLNCDDGVSSSRTWKSPGWGLPFLDTSRLMRRKGKSSVERENSSTKGVANEGRRLRTLPKLKSPSDPWLANALSSVNRARH